MCMCVREVSKCLYQTRTVMCIDVRYRHFDTSLTDIHTTVLAWYRNFDTSLTHMHITILAWYYQSR
jgi:hypothetical protein